MSKVFTLHDIAGLVSAVTRDSRPLQDLISLNEFLNMSVKKVNFKYEFRRTWCLFTYYLTQEGMLDSWVDVSPGKPLTLGWLSEFEFYYAHASKVIFQDSDAALLEKIFALYRCGTHQ